MHHSSSNCSKRGLSFAELLLIMTLILVVTGLMAGVSRQYADILRFSEGKARTLEAAQVALNRVASEAVSAVEFHQTGTTLEFDRIDPAVEASRLPLTGTPASWRPAASGDRVRIRYRLQNGELQRVVGGQPQLIASGLSDFSATLAEPSRLNVVLSLQEAKRLRTLSTAVYLPARYGP